MTGLKPFGGISSLDLKRPYHTSHHYDFPGSMSFVCVIEQQEAEEQEEKEEVGGWMCYRSEARINQQEAGFASLRLATRSQAKSRFCHMSFPLDQQLQPLRCDSVMVCGRGWARPDASPQGHKLDKSHPSFPWIALNGGPASLANYDRMHNIDSDE